MAAKGGRLSLGGSGERIGVQFKITGAEKTSAEFAAIRKDINRRMRDTMVRVGESVLLPDIVGKMPARWGDTLRIERQRDGVFVGSTLTNRSGHQLNRALGWWDFGGRRRRDTSSREGPHIIVREVNSHVSLIDEAIRAGIVKEFRGHGFEAS